MENIFTKPSKSAHYIGEEAKIINSLVAEGYVIYGEMENCVYIRRCYI